MKRFLYWIGALVLIVALLVGIGGLGMVIVDKHLPFPKIWGGAMALAGVAFIVGGVLFPSRLWGLSGGTIPADSLALRKATRIAAIFGALLVAGGVAFALTSEVWLLVGSFAAAGLYFRIAATSGPNVGGSNGPAA